MGGSTYTMSIDCHRRVLALEDGSFDAGPLDLDLPDSKGLDTFEVAWEFPEVPLIVLTGA